MFRDFDDFLVVDWSANDSAKTGKDSIWVASLYDCPKNHSTRYKCYEYLENKLIDSMKEKKRIFCAFDFCFGFPKGAVKKLREAKKNKSKENNWEWLWQYLCENIKDNENNQSNRFEVASEMNSLLTGGKGPFWGFVKNNRTEQPAYLSLKQKEAITDAFPDMRSDEDGQMKSVWQLAYNGAVGSQSLLGMAYLQKFRNHEKLGKYIRVFPFEDCSKAQIVFVETYFDSKALLLDKAIEPKDKAQVMAAVDFCHEAQERGILKDLLAQPDNPSITKDEGCVFRPESFTKTAKPKENAKNLSPDEIYAESFAIIKRETKFKSDTLEDKIRRRMIHACGDIDIADDIIIKGNLNKLLKQLDKPCKIITDSALCEAAIIKKHLPKQAKIICAIEQVGQKIPPNAIMPTRSAVAMEAIKRHLKDSILLIGNAPTALERVKLGITKENWDKPALIIGIPVGFVGAVESKEALHSGEGWDASPAYITLLGRKGGSAITAAALNAILLHKQGVQYG